MKKSRLLSALLAIVMLATVFSVAGIGATAVELPNEAYVLDETPIVIGGLNATATSKKTLDNGNANGNEPFADYSVTGVSPTNNYAASWKYVITDSAAMRKGSRYAHTLGATGFLKTIDNFLIKLNDYCVSFDLTVSDGFVNSSMRMELSGSKPGGTSGSSSLGFDYPLTEGTHHICIPLSELTHFNNPTTYNIQNWFTDNCTGIYNVSLIFGTNQYKAECTANSWFEISDFSIVDTSCALNKQEAEKVLSDSGYSLSYAKNSANPLTLEKVSDFEINGSTYNGFRGTVSDAAKFNTNNTEVLYTFDKSTDLTEDLADAKISFWLRLGGSLAETETPKIRVAVVTKLADGTEKNAYQNVGLTKTGDWQKVTLNMATDLPYGGVGINNCAIDNVVAIKFSNIGSSKYLQTNDTDELTPDALEIAGVNISKTVNAPVNASAIDLKISKVSLTLQDNLTMNFKVAKSLFDSKYANPYVMVGERKLEGVLSGDYYVFSYDGISPQNIRNTVSATVYATYGGAVIEGKTLEYSVKKYCDTLLASGAADEQTRTLIVDLLNYGAAAQEYTGVRVNNPANINLTTEQAGWGTAEMPIVIDHYEQRGEEGTVKWESAGLTLDDSVIVNLQFNAASKENLKVVVSDGTIPLATYEGDDIKSVDGDSFLVSFDGLNAKNMRRLIYVTVYDGETAVSNEVVYSVESYVRQVADLAAEGDASVDAKLVNLVNAMIKYGDAALVYAVR